MPRAMSAARARMNMSADIYGSETIGGRNDSDLITIGFTASPRYPARRSKLTAVACRFGRLGMIVIRHLGRLQTSFKPSLRIHDGDIINLFNQ